MPQPGGALQSPVPFWPCAPWLGFPVFVCVYELRGPWRAERDPTVLAPSCPYAAFVTQQPTSIRETSMGGATGGRDAVVTQHMQPPLCLPGLAQLTS